MADYRRLLSKKSGIYLKPEEFLAAAVDYFEWASEVPLQEEVLFHHRGHVTRTVQNKVRAFTKQGLATHLGLTAAQLDRFKKFGPGWDDVFELIEQVIYTQKFENAAAGLLNAGIITRDLGLAEKQQVGGIEGAPPLELNVTPMKSGTFLPEGD